MYVLSIFLFVLDSVIAQHLIILLVNVGHNIQGVYEKIHRKLQYFNLFQ